MCSSDLQNPTKIHHTHHSVGGGKDYVDKARHEAKPKVYRYHQPNDEYDESWWDFDGAMEDMNLMFSIGLVIANNDEMPKWTKEADFQRQ